MKRRSRGSAGTPQLEMTPMIDVVFQLLIFFIVAIKPADLVSRYNVWRPEHQRDLTTPVDLPVVEITVAQSGFALGGRSVSRDELDRQLARIGGLNPRAGVVVRCLGDSPHRHLVQVLDLCAKAGLKQLSVFSL